MCNITSNPSHYNVYWTRDLNGIKRTSYYGGNITFSPVLKFMSRVTFEESGQYICHAQNENGVGKSNPVNVTVFGGVPKVTIPTLQYSKGYYEHMTLECLIVSTPNHTDIYWQHMYNGTLRNITSFSHYDKYMATLTKPSLDIRRITKYDAGQYTCFAVNILGTGKSEPTTLTVLGGEILFETNLTDQTKVYGSEVTFWCSVEYEIRYGFRVTWNKYTADDSYIVSPKYYENGKVTLRNYSRHIPEKDGFILEYHFLTIKSLSFNDSARYRCFGTNEFSTEGVRSINLRIIGDIPLVHVEPGPYNVVYGGNITLQCNITSAPIHFNVYWKKESHGIISTWYYREVQSESFSILYLQRVSQDDTGLYICYVENVLGIGQSKAVNVTVYGEPRYMPPIVNIESNRYIVTYGSSLTMTCSVHTSEQNPVTDIYWKYNNNGVITKISEDTEGVTGSSIKVPSLTISNITTSEFGIFTCFATNDIGTGHSRPIHVTIIGDVPIVYVKDTRYSIKYGENVTIFCNITSNPPIKNVYWEREFNGTKKVINSWTAGVQGVSFDAPSLTIVKTTTSDNGSYRCIASNDVGTGYSEATNLEVIGELPYISITTDLPQVKYGEKVHILCAVNAIPPATKIYWEVEFNGIKKVIDNGTSGTEGITVANPSLILIHATDSDAGLYKCFAVNEFGMGYSSAIELNVIGGLPEVDVPSITHLTGIGYTITLTCSIKNGFPAISRVYWERYIHGSITRLSSASIGIMGVTIDNPSLIIPLAMESMTGEYTCLAVNSVGTGRSFPAKLTVKAGVTPDTKSEDNEDYNDQKRKKYRTTTNDSRSMHGTSPKNTAKYGNGSKKVISSC
ncbi:hemicentin-1-like [Mytilus californianus]|uniref:hemicentin-1-like n=1 Tax=Mytilus californianus TaxID=6549 RepID=UPI0022474885|nr:hemicentin-1-like [Mytilus californianus]